MSEIIYNINPAKKQGIRSSNLITDRFNRHFTYLRLAVNEYCNLRCIYCMPEEGVTFQSIDQLLTRDEIFRLLSLLVESGVNKIRFTGGEPLLRKDLPDLIQFASTLNRVNSVHLTTNGLLLDEKLPALLNAGLSGINISLDTLNPEKFKKITRRDGFEKVYSGFRAAVKSGIKSVKLNVVMMRGFNDDEIKGFVKLSEQNDITVRFIELMPFDAHQIWKTGKFYSARHILDDLHSQTDQLQTVSGSSTEHFVFRVKGALGKVAVIPAYSRNLCGACNRIRITADGKLLNCLFSHDETDLRAALRKGSTDEEIGALIKGSFLNKHQDGWSAQQGTGEHRESMTQIGG